MWRVPCKKKRSFLSKHDLNLQHEIRMHKAQREILRMVCMAVRNSACVQWSLQRKTATKNTTHFFKKNNMHGIIQIIYIHWVCHPIVFGFWVMLNCSHVTLFYAIGLNEVTSFQILFILVLPIRFYRQIYQNMLIK
jgi:hypothetical protein